MKVLILGANGLIGSNLINFLTLQNKDIRICAVVRNDPVPWIINKPLITIVNNEKHWGNDYDYVFHLATYAQPSRFMAEPLETYRVNTEILEKILERYGKRSKILFASSAEIYGNPPSEFIPTPESYLGNVDCTKPRSIYAESKRMGEAICSIYKERGVDVKIARICSVYGPGVRYDDKRVMSDLIRQAIEKKKIELLDDGHQIRTWCYVDDCVKQLWNIITEGKDWIYNVGGIDSKTIKELAEIIAEIIYSELGIKNDYPETHITKGPEKSILDISRVIREFQITQFVGLKEGLWKTIQFMKILGASQATGNA